MDIWVVTKEMHKNMAGLILLMESQPPLDSWIPNGNTCTYMIKQTK